MLNIKEAVDKTRPQLAKTKEFMEQHNYFDPQQCNIYAGLKRSTQRELSETLHKCTLRDLLKGLSKRELKGLKEFLPTAGGLTTGSLGTAGAQYLVPTWMSQKLYAASTGTDIVPLISADVFEPRGGDCTVPIGVLATQQLGEGTVAHETVDADAATIKLVKISAPIVATNEMIEDTEYGLIEWHIQKAGEAMGRTGGNLALNVLKTATDGYGTVVTGAASASETKPNEILDVFEEVSRGDSVIQPVCDTMIITPEAWSHSASGVEVAGGTAGDFWRGEPITQRSPAQGFTLVYHGMDTLFSGSTSICTGGGGAAMTECKTIVFDRKQAMVTARKNWLRIEDYSNPVMDLAGAIVSGRQDSVTVVDCAIGVVTEA